MLTFSKNQINANVESNYSFYHLIGAKSIGFINNN